MTLKRRILVAAAYNDLAQILLEQLELEKGFLVYRADTVGQISKLLEHKFFDVLLVDGQLEKVDNLKFYCIFRGNRVRIPIVYLSSESTSGSSLSVDESHIINVLGKPFKIESLLEKLWFQIRQFEKDSFTEIPIGPYLFTFDQNLLYNDDKKEKIRLTEKESAIIKRLLISGGERVSKETLLAELWGYSSGVSTHTLETHIYSLRQKMGRRNLGKSFLIAEQGGYRLTA